MMVLKPGWEGNELTQILRKDWSGDGPARLG